MKQYYKMKKMKKMEKMKKVANMTKKVTNKVTNKVKNTVTKTVTNTVTKAVIKTVMKTVTNVANLRIGNLVVPVCHIMAGAMKPSTTKCASSNLTISFAIS